MLFVQEYNIYICTTLHIYRAAWLVFVVAAFVISGLCIKESIDGEETLHAHKHMCTQAVKTRSQSYDRDLQRQRCKKFTKPPACAF
jgi:hypothetical protein